jgi:hypothetical protein
MDVGYSLNVRPGAPYGTLQRGTGPRSGIRGSVLGLQGSHGLGQWQHKEGSPLVQRTSLGGGEAREVKAASP